MKPVPLLFKKMNYGVRESVIKVKALKDKGNSSSIFMRFCCRRDLIGQSAR